MEAVYAFIEAFRWPMEAAGVECWFRVAEREVVIRHEKGELYGTLHVSRRETVNALHADDFGRIQAERVLRYYQQKGGE